MSTRPSNVTPSTLSAILRSRLCWRIALCVLASVLAIEIVILIPSHRNYERHLLGNLETTARAVLLAGLEGDAPDQAAALAAAGRRAMDRSRLVGGSILGPSGEPLASFGEAPESTVPTTAAEGRRRAGDGDARYEVLWPADPAGPPLALLARLDSGGIRNELLAYNLRIAGLILLICVVVFVVTMAALGRFVLRPILEMQARMAAAPDLTESADPALPLTEMTDELGDVGSAFNALVRRVVDAHKRKLAAQERRIQDFAKASTDFFWEMDADLRFRFFSKRFAAITGVAHKQLLGRTREELGLPGIDPETWRRHLDDLAAHRPFRSFVYPQRRPDGRTVWLSLSGVPLFDGAGRFTGYRGSGSDVTSRKLAEEALLAAKEQAEEARAHLMEAIGAMSEGIALFDRRDRLIICNAKYHELFPESGRAIRVGAGFRSILQAGLERGAFAEAKGREGDWLADRLAKSDEGEVSFEEPLSDGRWLRINERRTEAGGRVRTWMDISELKRREAELTAAKQLAERANQAKSEFLANMSHELRTPLNAIIGFSEVILNSSIGPVGNPKYVEYAGDIHESGHHLLSLINEILDLSKIEAGKLELNESFVDVRRALETCLGITSEPMAEAGLVLETDLPASLPGLWVDDLKLKQIVINLLSNAIKFSEPADCITLAAGVARDGWFEIAVGDTGIGMAEDEISIALAPFGQVNNALDRRHAGTGLGLPLTKSLAELHGGTLSIDSAPGRGTRVTVRFPPHRVRGPSAVAREVRAS